MGMMVYVDDNYGKQLFEAGGSSFLLSLPPPPLSLTAVAAVNSCDWDGALAVGVGCDGVFVRRPPHGAELLKVRGPRPSPCTWSSRPNCGHTKLAYL